MQPGGLGAMSSPPIRTVSSLNLLKIRFPVGAVASISHRISGGILLLALPFAVEAFARSLATEAGYEALRGLLRNPAVLILLLLPCWALAQHLLAGIRHLLMDVDVGSGLPTARRTAWLVLVGGVLGTGALMWGLLG
jgi:succinate dehydrogenase / fumarate reductase, cytochrome b subunit